MNDSDQSSGFILEDEPEAYVTPSGTPSHYWFEIVTYLEAQSHDAQSHDAQSHETMDGMSGEDTDMGNHDHSVALQLIGDNPNIATVSGDWSDPGIWSKGRVPENGEDVHINEDVFVNYDLDNSPTFDVVQVDGTLWFQHDTDTLMNVDTLVVNMQGSLFIGDEMHEVSDNVTAKIIFDSDLSVHENNADTTQIGKGLIAMGHVEMDGADKAAYAIVSDVPEAGETFVTFSSVAEIEGWSSGDTIVISGTEYVAKEYVTFTLDDTTIEARHLAGDEDKPLSHANNDGLQTFRDYEYMGSQDEVREISSIEVQSNGTVLVNFSDPLDYDHDVPLGATNAPVANLTRNIEIASENGDLGTDHRGHVMFMSDDVEIDGVAFNDLGRTDKSTVSDNNEIIYENSDFFHFNDNGGPNDDATNVKGRYAVHFHQAGDVADGNPAVVEGSVVNGSPGWGFVTHDSYANFIDNVAYDVYGSSFVAETGNEVGLMQGNIAIKGEGRDTHIKAGIRAMDLGAEGYGFWFNGRSMDVVDNIAVGMQGSGFAWFTRGDEMIDTMVSNLPGEVQIIARGLEEIDTRYLPTGTVENNTIFASEIGMELIRDAESGPQQYNDSRGLIQGVEAINVVSGIKLEYSSSYTFADVKLYGHSQEDSAPTAEYTDATVGYTGVYTTNDGVTYTNVSDIIDDLGYIVRDALESDPAYAAQNAGFSVGRNYEDLVVIDADADNFKSGIDVYLQNNGLTGNEDSYYFGNFYNKGFRSDLTGFSDNTNPGEIYLVTPTFADNADNINRDGGYIDTPAEWDEIFIANNEITYNELDLTLNPQSLIAFYAPLIGVDGTDSGTTINREDEVTDHRWNKDIYLTEGTAQTALVNQTAAYAAGLSLELVGTKTDGFGTVRYPEGNERIIYTQDQIAALIERDGYFEGADGEYYITIQELVTDRLPNLVDGEYVLNQKVFEFHVQLGDGWTAEFIPAEYEDTDSTVVYSNDTLTGSVTGGIDEVSAINEYNLIAGNYEDDVLDGTATDDMLFGNDGADIINGGDGSDVISGGRGDDTLAGNGGDDTLEGGDGADRLEGNGGDDILRGNGGDDSLHGRIGADTLYGGDGVDNLYGGNGADHLYGEDGDDILEGGSGADYLYGGDGVDILEGGDGADTLRGNAGTDRLEGNSGADHLYGGDDVDNLYGGNGADHLYGGTGADNLFGGNGNDNLYGGRGNDSLTGGNGQDTFEFRALSDGIDIITDFDNTEDTIDLSDLLSGYDSAIHEISDFLLVLNDGMDTTLSVSEAGTSSNFVQIALIEDVMLDTNGDTLLSDETIIL